MAVIYIIHGAYGNPQENWFPWLKDSLEKEGHEVILPSFPTPENQSLREWYKILSSSDIERDDIIFVGHSLGPAFILHLLEKSKAKAAFLVAGFISPLSNPQFDSINETFIEEGFDWNRIRNHCENFFVYHSDNDPYVSLDHAYELADKLGVKPKIIKHAGHFNRNAGYMKFEILLNDILSLSEN